VAREDVLDQAEELFAEHGYMGTSMADVAAAVGIRKPSLYSHFSAKSDLYFAVIDRVHARFRDEIRHLAAQELPPKEHLRRQMRRICTHGPVNHFRFTLFPPQDLVDRAVPVFTDFDRYFRGVIRGVLRQYLGEEITEERITGLVGMYIYLMNGLLSIDKFVSEEQLADRVEISFALFWELVEKNPSSG
jgi:AcrR family transcriptional regulator